MLKNHMNETFFLKQPCVDNFLGPNDPSHKGLNIPHFWRHPQKNKTQNLKMFYCELEDLPGVSWV